MEKPTSHLHNLGRIRPHHKKRKKKSLDEIIHELNIDDHKIGLDELCTRYSADLEKGLTTEVAREKNVIYGLNTLTPTTVRFEFLKFLKAIFGGFSLLLWGGALLSFTSVMFDIFSSHQPNLDNNFYLGCILIAIAILTGCLSYYQQSKSSKIIDSFEKMVPQYATVIRNGKLQTIPAEELTKGDLVEIKSGDRVPADIRVISAKKFKVDISQLTGESLPQLRTPQFTNDHPLETMNLVFFSSNAIEGICRGIVINIGDNTIIGRIVGLASHFTTDKTQVAKEIRRLIRITIGIAFFFGILYFIIEFGMGVNWLHIVIGLVGIIVANAPEGLPITVTICLRLISKRMAQKNCLVDNLGAIETLGSTSIIITDKTGTLTQNILTVAHLWFDNQIFESNAIEGQTDFTLKNSIGFKELSRSAILCSQYQFDSNQTNNTNLIKKEGSASEFAIFKFMNIVIGDLTQFHSENPKLHEIPFTSANKYQVSIHKIQTEDKNSRLLLIMKGAPERVFDRCSTILIDGNEYIIDEDWRTAFQIVYDSIADLGELVLGFCDLVLPGKYTEDIVFDIENPNFPLNSLRFVGLISMVDPPRASVPAAISICRNAGIKVIMVTGEHPITAKAVARSVGIISHGNETSEEISSRLGISELSRGAKAIVIHGGTLKDFTSTQLDDILENYEDIVFARTTPRQKLILVEACQRFGSIVAVTGASVNDAPSLQKAEIGVAMGIAGSDVAKQAADIILLDDNFATLVTGIEEGRLIFDNLKKCIAYTLTSNIPEMTPFFLSIILGVPLPVGIISILCIDIGTDLIPAISIAYELPESDIMKHKPRHPRAKLVNQRLLFSSGCIGIVEALAGFYSYFVIMAENGFLPWDLINVRALWIAKSVNNFEDSYGQEWTFSARLDLLYTCQTGFFVAIVIVQWANLIICKTRRNSIYQQGMKNWVLNFGLIFEILLVILLTYAPGTKSTLKTYPLDWLWWFLPLPFAIFIFVYDEIRRYMIRHYFGGWVEYETYY